MLGIGNLPLRNGPDAEDIQGITASSALSIREDL